LSRLDNIDRGEQVPDLHLRTCLFAGLASRAFGHCLAEFHETGWHGPEPPARLYGAPAKQDFPVLLRHAADHDLRVLVVDCAATLANETFTIIARRHFAADGLAAVHAEFHFRKLVNRVRWCRERESNSHSVSRTGF